MRLRWAAAAFVAFAVAHLADRRSQKCLRTVNDRVMMGDMYAAPADRLVLVPATSLDDLLELARLAADRLPEQDPLRYSLIGANAQVRSSLLVEP